MGTLQTSHPQNSQPPRRPAPRPVVVLVVGVGLLAFGVWMLIALVVNPFLHRRAIEAWVETPCVIEWSRVQEISRGHHTKAHSPEARYRYQFNGREYASQRYALDYSGETTREEAAATVAILAPGSQQKCYVDPGHPEDAVLLREIKINWGVVALAALVGLPSVWLGAKGIILAAKRWRGARNPAVASHGIS